MSTNMSNLDRGLRGLLVAPLAIVLAIIVGAGSIVGILLFALAAIMLATAPSASARCTGSCTSTHAAARHCRTDRTQRED
jgi:hypothetical protein